MGAAQRIHRYRGICRNLEFRHVSTVYAVTDAAVRRVVRASRTQPSPETGRSPGEPGWRLWCAVAFTPQVGVGQWVS